MKVLFMCTANSCRSILSEALFNHRAPPGYTAVSAGSFPGGTLNARALATLRAAGVTTAGLSSKGAEVFAADPPDVVITVCDQAAGEPCPLYFGPAIKSHWGLADPSEVHGSEAQIQAAFDATLAQIERRFAAFFALQPAHLPGPQLKQHLDRIGVL